MSKTPTPGWTFSLQIFALLLNGSKDNIDEAIWGYLENICHRYGLGASDEDGPAVAETCVIAGTICADMKLREDAYSMEDEEDARTVVESYVARMTPCSVREPLHQSFCASLIDFVFGEWISSLGDLLYPMIRVGYERIWLELSDENIARDVVWGTNTAQFIMNTLASTQRLFSAEKWFKSTEIEAFVPPLHDVDIAGLLGQALLLPTNLLLDDDVDGMWAKLIKSTITFAQTLAYSKGSAVAEKLFADEYSTWFNTLKYIRLQILNNPNKD
ncbi:hypothetical protein FRC07_006526, partial [Ceratobasidium sp. 392]